MCLTLHAQIQTILRSFPLHSNVWFKHGIKLRSLDFYKASLLLKSRNQNWLIKIAWTALWIEYWLVYVITHHNTVGKIRLWIQETFTVFKIITRFKNKPPKTHLYTRTWLHRVFTAQSTVHNVLNTWLDSYPHGRSPVGTMLKTMELHLRKSTPALFSGAAITKLLLAQYHSYWSHQGCSCLMLMAVAVHVGRDSICQALPCFCWHQW